MKKNIIINKLYEFLKLLYCFISIKLIKKQNKELTKPSIDTIVDLFKFSHHFHGFIKCVLTQFAIKPAKSAHIAEVPHFA